MRETTARDPPASPDDDEEVCLLPRKANFSWDQLILDVGIAPNKESVGFYSGCIETVASIFSFAAVIPGSFAADHWGRKLVLCSTLLGTAASLLLLGVSESLAALIACRSLGYALGPQLAWSITVTILGDVSDSSNRGIAYSAVNASYRIGQLFSPVFAGVLAHPRARYAWFQSEFWARYPYALPCWAGAMTCIGALYITVCFVPETSPSICHKSPSDALGGEYCDGYYSATVCSNNLSKSRPVSVSIEDETAPSIMLPATLEPVTRATPHQPGIRLLTPHVVQLLISSWIMYFMTMTFFALFPLWAFTPVSSGGLGASEIVIGSYISTRAIVHFVGLIPFAYFEARFGVYPVYAFSLTIFAVGCSLLFPFLSMLARTDGIHSLRFNLVIVLSFVLGSFANYCSTCMVIMTNQAAPSPEALAQIVGISQSVLMLGQCMAPVVTLSLFEFSIKSGLLGGNLIWVFLVGTGILGSLHAFTLEKPVLAE